jgi:hypothetical protein
LLGALAFVARWGDGCGDDFGAAVKLLCHLVIDSLHAQNFVAFVDHD